MEYPKISIVTPNFNGATYLEKTIKSILDQQYPNLEYIIVDGGSTDKSVEIIKRYENHLAYWISESDDGLYHALNKGFSMTSGEIMGWLNSDDMLHQKSLFTIAEIFQHREVEWIQGLHSWFDEKGRTFKVEKVNLKSKYNYLLKEYHNTFSPFVQQESTYWKRAIWDRAGGFISTKYKLAGDFELWMRFFQHGDLYLTSSLIGGFRLTGNGQLSIGNYTLYLDEADTIIDKYKLSNEEKKEINFLTSKSILDKIPYVRRTRYHRRKGLLNGRRNCVWDTNIKQFVIK